jgi:hypothetical protein
VLSDTGYDELFRGRNPGQAPWTPQDSCLHHWAVLSNIVAEVCACPQIHSRLELVEVLVNRALANYTVLEHSGVPFERASGTGNLESWLRAIRIFRSEAGI